MAITGLSKQALYAWERRYNVVSPRRNAQGVRSYSENEVHRLQLLRQGVDKGHRIGTLAGLGLNELKEVVRSRVDASHAIVAELAEAVDRLDFPLIEQKLPFHFSTFGPGRFTRDLVLPVMSEIGKRVEAGSTSIPGERFFSTMIRMFLGQALHLTAGQLSAPRILFATPEGELHDLALLAAAVSAQQLGCRAVCLGTQLAPDALALACAKTDVAVLCLSISSLPRDLVIGACRDIRLAIPPRTRLWVGGQAVRDLRQSDVPGTRIYDDIDDFDDAIRRIRVSMTL
ncbi:MAG: MerR family transcriptional regulator [Hyphomicrobiaceae bacterium]|nr:MerR family transcriptional regulator [Hyphomicrobiaceae bacterium]